MALKGLSTKLLIELFVVLTVIAISLRFSEQYGPNAVKGCVFAIVLSLIAAFAGIMPLLMSGKKRAYKFFISLLTGAGIRIGITALGVIVAIVILEKEQRFWFLAWTGVFYLLFLGIETIEAVYCIKKLEFENDTLAENSGHDAGKYESS